MSSLLYKYATTATVYFPLVSYNSVSFTSTASLTTADMKISLDGAAFGTVGTAIVNVGSYGYSYSLTTANLTCKKAIMIIHHTAASPTFEDQCLLFETYGNSAAQHTFDLSIANQTVIASAGTVTLSANQSVIASAGTVTVSAGTITSVTGNVGGISGITFPTNFSALSITAVTGLVSISTAASVNVGTNNDKTGYGISSAAVTSVWSQALTQPSAVPSITASILSAMAWMFTLTHNKITQTSTVQTLYQTDGSTTIAAATVADDGTTFTRGSFN